MPSLTSTLGGPLGFTSNQGGLKGFAPMVGDADANFLALANANLMGSGGFGGMSGGLSRMSSLGYGAAGSDLGGMSLNTGGVGSLSGKSGVGKGKGKRLRRRKKGYGKVLVKGLGHGLGQGLHGVRRGMHLAEVRKGGYKEANQRKMFGITASTNGASTKTREVNDAGVKSRVNRKRGYELIKAKSGLYSSSSESDSDGSDSSSDSSSDCSSISSLHGGNNEGDDLASVAQESSDVQHDKMWNAWQVFSGLKDVNSDNMSLTPLSTTNSTAGAPTHEKTPTNPTLADILLAKSTGTTLIPKKNSESEILPQGNGNVSSFNDVFFSHYLDTLECNAAQLNGIKKRHAFMTALGGCESTLAGSTIEGAMGMDMGIAVADPSGNIDDDVNTITRADGTVIQYKKNTAEFVARIPRMLSGAAANDLGKLSCFVYLKQEAGDVTDMAQDSKNEVPTKKTGKTPKNKGKTPKNTVKTPKAMLNELKNATAAADAIVPTPKKCLTVPVPIPLYQISNVYRGSKLQSISYIRLPPPEVEMNHDSYFSGSNLNFGNSFGQSQSSSFPAASASSIGTGASDSEDSKKEMLLQKLLASLEGLKGKLKGGDSGDSGTGGNNFKNHHNNYESMLHEEYQKIIFAESMRLLSEPAGSKKIQKQLQEVSPLFFAIRSKYREVSQQLWEALSRALKESGKSSNGNVDERASETPLLNFIRTHPSCFPRCFCGDFTNVKCDRRHLLRGMKLDGSSLGGQMPMDYHSTMTSESPGTNLSNRSRYFDRPVIDCLKSDERMCHISEHTEDVHDIDWDIVNRDSNTANNRTNPAKAKGKAKSKSKAKSKAKSKGKLNVSSVDNDGVDDDDEEDEDINDMMMTAGNKSGIKNTSLTGLHASGSGAANPISELDYLLMREWGLQSQITNSESSELEPTLQSLPFSDTTIDSVSLAETLPKHFSLQKISQLISTCSTNTDILLPVVHWHCPCRKVGGSHCNAKVLWTETAICDHVMQLVREWIGESGEAVKNEIPPSVRTSVIDPLVTPEVEKFAVLTYWGSQPLRDLEMKVRELETGVVRSSGSGKEVDTVPVGSDGLGFDTGLDFDTHPMDINAGNTKSPLSAKSKKNEAKSKNESQSLVNPKSSTSNPSGSPSMKLVPLHLGSPAAKRVKFALENGDLKELSVAESDNLPKGLKSSPKDLSLTLSLSPGNTKKSNIKSHASKSLYNGSSSRNIIHESYSPNPNSMFASFIRSVVELMYGDIKITKLVKRYAQIGVERMWAPGEKPPGEGAGSLGEGSLGKYEGDLGEDNIKDLEDQNGGFDTKQNKKANAKASSKATNSKTSLEDKNVKTRGRGRPPGSKNKTAEQKLEIPDSPKIEKTGKQRGRPKGAKNKASMEKQSTEKESSGKKTTEKKTIDKKTTDKEDAEELLFQELDREFSDSPKEKKKDGRGRPKGSKNKKGTEEVILQRGE